METSSRSTFSSRLQSIPRIAALTAIAVGILVLIGWVFDITLFKSISSGWIAMSPPSAVLFILCGLSLLLFRTRTPNLLTRGLSAVCAGVVLLVSTLTLVEYIYGWDTGVDHLLFPDAILRVNTAYPGRMAVTTAFSFMLLALGLLLLTRRSRLAFHVVEILVSLADLLTLVVLLIYLFDFSTLNNTLAHTQMALHTALTLSILSTSILLSFQPTFAIKVLSGDGLGSVSIRRLLPPAILVPAILGWLSFLGQKVGLYDPVAGVAIFTASNIVILCVFIGWNAESLNATDASRRQAEAALRKSEERFRTSVENMLDPYAILTASRDASGQIVDFIYEYINDAGLKALGLERSAILEKGFVTIFPRHRVSGILADYIRVVETGAPLSKEDLYYESNHVLRHAFDVRAAKFNDGLVVIWRDITERKKNELALAKATQDLKQSNEELEQFAYVASHDLQEPLRMVSGYLQLISQRYQGKLDADADEFIFYAVDGSQRMQRLIRDLLEYSRVGTGSAPVRSVDSELALLQALSNLQVMIEENKAAVTYDPLPEVVANDGQLTTVFQNLVGNGIKFHNAVAPAVHVSAREDGNQWVFSVRDNGIGIAPEYLDQIFVIFKRLHTREEFPGSGIGLATCKKIVERHGGRLWVESAPGSGSTFSFSLPKDQHPTSA